MPDSDRDTLLPPVHVINDRLTRNQRERHVLRTLLRLIVDQNNDQTAQDRRRQRPAAGKAVAQ